MSGKLNESEMTVFRKFRAKRMSLQHQPDDTYHIEIILRDLQLTAVYIPSTQFTLRDWMPRTRKKAAKRVTSQLGDSKGENEFAWWRATKRTNRLEKSRGKRGAYNEETMVKYEEIRETSACKDYVPGMDEGGHGMIRLWRGPQLELPHRKEEVTRDVNRLKEKHPRLSISVEYFDAVVLITVDDGGGGWC